MKVSWDRFEIEVATPRELFELRAAIVEQERREIAEDDRGKAAWDTDSAREYYRRLTASGRAIVGVLLKANDPMKAGQIAGVLGEGNYGGIAQKIHGVMSYARDFHPARRAPVQRFQERFRSKVTFVLETSFRDAMLLVLNPDTKGK